MQEPVTPIGFNSKLVHFFNTNVHLSILVLLSLVLGGFFSLRLLHSQGFPSPTINIAIITDSYRGASAVEMERSVVKPLESAVSGVRGVSDVHSTARDGFASLSVSFTAGTDFNAALSEVRSKVVSAEIPKEADRPDVTVPEIGGNTSFYAITGEGTPASLRAAGELVRQKLEAVAGVKQFKLASTQKDQVEIRWRPADLATHGLTPIQISQAIAANNVSIPAGSVESDGRQKTVVTTDQLVSANDLKKIVVGADLKTRAPVTLDQVADIVPTVQTDDLYQRVGAKDGGTDQKLAVRSALIYQLQFKDGADLLKTDDLVRAALMELKSGWGEKTVFVIPVLDVAASTHKQIDEIVSGAVGGKLGSGPLAGLGYLLGGIWLVVLAMLVFVSWRAGLISATAIPLSLLFTFLSLKVLGADLNTLTLFSMVLVLGLVVDPAIVVLEAVQRELDLGKKGRDAVIAAINTIGTGVFMAALTSIIVFVPFGVVSGIFGQIIRYIPLTVIPALIASYFVPLLFLTFLAQRFLRPAKRAVEGNEEANLWRAGRWFIRANAYILRRWWLSALVVILLGIGLPFGIAGYLFSQGKIHQVQFSSPTDVTQAAVTVEYPANLTMQDKQDLVAKVEPILVATPEIKNYFVSTQNSASTQLFVTLLDANQRTRSSKDILADLDGRLAALADTSKKIYLSTQSLSAGPPGNDFPVAVNIYGDDLAKLKAAAIQTGDVLRAQPNVTRVEDGFSGVQTPALQVRLDPARLQAHGLIGLQVAQIVSGTEGQSTVTRFSQTIDGAERPVEVVLVNADQPKTVQQIGAITLVPGVQVKDVATVEESEGFAGINRLNESRFVTVQAQVKDALKDAAAPQKAVKDFWTFDKLASFGLRSDALQDKGSGDQFLESFQNLFIALGVSILLTYIVLALYFRSFLQPFIILSSIPLALIGVLPALAAIGGQFGFLEILGVITLVGIVENVGIFLIDLANRKRRSGLDEITAISQATGVRLRPIFLTKVTALGGLLPLMLISPFWRSLAVVVVSGILTSGVLSLFVTPVLYCWLIWIKRWPAKILRRK